MGTVNLAISSGIVTLAPVSAVIDKELPDASPTDLEPRAWPMLDFLSKTGMGTMIKHHFSTNPFVCPSKITISQGPVVCCSFT